MTVPDTHLGEPLRPPLSRTTARALIGGVWGSIALLVLALVASASPAMEAVGGRLLLPERAFMDPVGLGAQVVLAAILFTVPIVIVLERGDRRPVAAELVFAAVLAGTTTTVLAPTAEDGSNAAGVVVAVLAIHWVVYGDAGPRSTPLARRSAVNAGAVLLLIAAAAGAWRSWAEPVTVRTDGDAWHQIRARDVAPRSVVSGPVRHIGISVQNESPARATIVGASSATPGLTILGVTLPDETPDSRWYFNALEPLTLAPGASEFFDLVTTAPCDADLRSAKLELAYAGGRSSTVPLSGTDPGTCAAPRTPG